MLILYHKKDSHRALFLTNFSKKISGGGGGGPPPHQYDTTPLASHHFRHLLFSILHLLQTLMKPLHTVLDNSHKIGKTVQETRESGYGQESKSVVPVSVRPILNWDKN